MPCQKGQVVVTPGDLYSIGEVSEATGISPETLRIWERRYGRPEPVRLPSGHRRFTEDHLRWLRRVAEALARGFRPGRVLRLDDAELDALLRPAPAEPAVDAETQALLALAREFRGRELFEQLERHWDENAYVEYLTKRLGRFLGAVGRAWADGDLDVRHEHFVSEIVNDLVRKLRMSYPATAGSPRVLFTTLQGETHGLGLQMTGLVCAANGVAFRILGVDTPSAEIVRAAAELEPQAVAISVSLATGGIETDRAVAALRRELPAEVRLYLGGSGARTIRRGPRGVIYLDGLAAWDAAVKELGG